ncbi:LemA family protein [uncultured Roseibium sp.]|uniref:LemA family protein n=1 Tax=uncultured Roseibium sp. TaxID=1936171 RepID=UPI0026041FF3|nr:LemA family protein [uncultured Roseibium sp.]
MTTLFILLIMSLGGFVYLQNRLAAARNAVANGRSGIQVQLKRRHDLVPGLVSAVRSAIRQENHVFDRLLDVREKAIAVRQGSLEDIERAENNLTAGLSTFLGYTEHHPDVTSTENILQLQKQLEETEDQISAARRLYNGNVDRYNTLLDAIPSCWVGSLLGFERAAFFALDADQLKSAEAVPPIDLTREPS